MSTQLRNPAYSLPKQEPFEAPTEIFALLGHPVRYAILRYLIQCSPIARRTSEIAAALRLAPSAIAQHLDPLHRAGIVELSRVGRTNFYELEVDQIEKAVEELLDGCCRYGQPY